VAWIDCTWESIIEAGDHYIAIGRVGSVDVVRPALPLLFFQGGYGRFSLPSLVAGSDPDLIHSIRLAESARDEIEAVAEEFAAECSVLAPVGEDSVFVALASRSSVPSNISLGFHVPLVPPIGSVFVSSLGSVAINAWLSRIPESDEETLATYIAKLERVRERGYSLSLRGSHSDRQMFAAARDYSSPTRLPEHERRFRTIIREQAHLYEPDIEPDGVYDLHSIVVPVPGPLGMVQIALRLANTPSGATGVQVQQWITRLQQAAQAVADRIAAQPVPAAQVTAAI
jgi:DNA-binding IclR family transcriptional regulator